MCAAFVAVARQRGIPHRHKIGSSSVVAFGPEPSCHLAVGEKLAEWARHAPTAQHPGLVQLAQSAAKHAGFWRARDALAGETAGQNGFDP